MVFFGKLYLFRAIFERPELTWLVIVAVQRRAAKELGISRNTLLGRLR